MKNYFYVYVRFKDSTQMEHRCLGEEAARAKLFHYKNEKTNDKNVVEVKMSKESIINEENV